MCWDGRGSMKAARPSRYHVWARALRAYLDLAKLARVPVDGAFEGMPFDAASLRALWVVRWDDFCTVTERLEELCGGPEPSRQLLRQSYHQTLPELRSLVGNVICPVSFTRIAVGVLSPVVYQGCAFSVKDLGQHRVRIELRLRAGARPSRTFFRATVGELEALPRHLGLPPAVVSAELSDVHGDYDVLLRAGESPRPELDSRLTAAEATWRLTSRQAEVLRHVAQGASNKEIARELGCAENTVELHVTKLLHKASVPSRTRLIARFWASF